MGNHNSLPTLANKLMRRSQEQTQSLLASVPFETLEYIASLVLTKKIRTAVDLAKELQCSEGEAILLMADKRFKQCQNNLSMEYAKTLFVMESLPELHNIAINGEDEDVQVKAIDKEAKILGFEKDKGVNINISLESILEGKELPKVIDVKLEGLD